MPPDEFIFTSETLVIRLIANLPFFFEIVKDIPLKYNQKYLLNYGQVENRS